MNEQDLRGDHEVHNSSTNSLPSRLSNLLPLSSAKLSRRLPSDDTDNRSSNSVQSEAGQNAAAAAASRIPVPLGRRQGRQLSGNVNARKQSSDSEQSQGSQQRRRLPNKPSTKDELYALASDAESGLGETLVETSTEQLEWISTSGQTKRLYDKTEGSGAATEFQNHERTRANNGGSLLLRTDLSCSAPLAQGSPIAAVTAKNQLSTNKPSSSTNRQLLYHISPPPLSPCNSSDSVESRENVERALLEADRNLQVHMAANAINHMWNDHDVDERVIPIEVASCQNEGGSAGPVPKMQLKRDSRQFPSGRKSELSVGTKPTKEPSNKNGETNEKGKPLLKLKTNFDIVENEVKCFKQTSLPVSIAEPDDYEEEELSSDNCSLISGLTEPDPDEEPVPMQDSATQTPRCRSTQTLESVASQTNLFGLRSGDIDSSVDNLDGYQPETAVLGDLNYQYPTLADESHQNAPYAYGKEQAVPKVLNETFDISNSPRLLDADSSDEETALMPSLLPRDSVGEARNMEDYNLLNASTDWGLAAHQQPWNETSVSRLSWPLASARYVEDYSKRFFDSEAASLPAQTEQYQVSTQTPVRVRINHGSDFAVVGDIPTDNMEDFTLPPWTTLDDMDSPSVPQRDFTSQTFGQMSSPFHKETQTINADPSESEKISDSEVESPLTGDNKKLKSAPPTNVARKDVLRMLLDQVRQLRTIAEGAQDQSAKLPEMSRKKKKHHSKPRKTNSTDKNAKPSSKNKTSLPHNDEREAESDAATSEIGSQNSQPHSTASKKDSKSLKNTKYPTVHRKLPDIPHNLTVSPYSATILPQPQFPLQNDVDPLNAYQQPFSTAAEGLQSNNYSTRSQFPTAELNPTINNPSGHHNNIPNPAGTFPFQPTSQFDYPNSNQNSLHTPEHLQQHLYPYSRPQQLYPISGPPLPSAYPASGPTNLPIANMLTHVNNGYPAAANDSGGQAAMPTYAAIVPLLVPNEPAYPPKQESKRKKAKNNERNEALRDRRALELSLQKAEQAAEEMKMLSEHLQDFF